VCEQHCDGMILHAYIFMDDGTMPVPNTDNCYIIVLHSVIRVSFAFAVLNSYLK
jgi:hypothetical protein